MAGQPTLSQALTYTGAPTTGEQPSFLNALAKALAAAGVTQVRVTSGYRSPGHNAAVGGVQDSNHLTGTAIDGYALLNNKWIPLGDVPTLAKFGLRSGDQPGFFNGGRDPVHVDMGHPAGGTGQSAPQTSWAPSAQLAYKLALGAGLNPRQATDFAAVQYGESGFNPNARNKSSGAAGLYQLLSKGYVDRANQMGGVLNPVANIKAILPNYVAYYGSHPGFVPGAAGAAVEASGEPASYYAAGWQHLGDNGVPLPPGGTGTGMGTAPGPPGRQFAPGTLAAVQAAHAAVGLGAVGPALAALLSR